MNNPLATLPASGLSALLAKNGLADIDLFKREILVLQCVVAGTSFRNIHKVEHQLQPETKLKLQREPENEYDEFAIKILLEDYHIGYIPRESNEVVARLMDAGKNFHATIVRLEWQGTWARIDVNVFLND